MILCLIINRSILQLFLLIFYISLKVFFMNEVIENLKIKLKENKPIVVQIKVIAGAKQNSIENFSEDILKVKINKPAVDGKANKAIVEYFSDILDLPKKNIIIISGEKNTVKNLRIIPKSYII